MLHRARYKGVGVHPDEFKREAVKQVVGGGHPVAEVASRLGVSTKSIYTWLRDGHGRSRATKTAETTDGLRDEVGRLKNELKRTKEGRDILGKTAVESTGRCNDTFSMMIHRGGFDGTNGTAWRINLGSKS